MNKKICLVDISSIFSRFCKDVSSCASDYFTSLTVATNVLVSCFYAFGCLREEYASLSDDLRTPESFTDLTAF